MKISVLRTTAGALWKVDSQPFLIDSTVLGSESVGTMLVMNITRERDVIQFSLAPSLNGIMSCGQRKPLGMAGSGSLRR